MGLFGRGDGDADSATLIERARELLAQDEPDVDKASKLLKRARETGDLNALPLLGDIAYEAGDHAGGIALWAEAAEAGVPAGMRDYGVYHLVEGDLESAVTWLERAAEAGDDSAYLPLASAEGQRGDTVRARVLLESLVDGDKFSAGACAWVAKGYGDLDFARELFLQAADAGDPLARVEAGVILLGSGNRDEAIAQFERAAVEGITLGLYNIGVILEQEGDREGARRQYEQGAALGGPECVRALGIMSGAEGDYESAVRSLREAAALGDEIALRNLATTLLEIGEVDSARECAEMMAAAGDPEGLTILGYILEQRGDIDAADDHYRRAAEHGEPSALFNYANRLMRDGDREGARALYEKSAAAGIPAAMNSLGVLAEEDGATAAALDWYARAAEEGNETAVANLAKLKGQALSDDSEPLDFTGPPLRAAGIALEEYETIRHDALTPGLLTKVHLTVAFPGGGEYVWCEIESIDGDVIIGRLTNILAHEALRDLPFGQRFRFNASHVLEARSPDDASSDSDSVENMELMADDGSSLGTMGGWKQRFDDGEIIRPEALSALVHYCDDVRAAAISACFAVGRGNLESVNASLHFAAAGGNADALALIDALAADSAPDDERAPLQVVTEWLHDHPDAFTEATDWLVRAAGAEPSSYAHAAGAMLRERGQLDAAEAILQPAIRAGIPHCKRELAQVHSDRGDYESAIILLRELGDEGDDGALVLGALALLRLKRGDEAGLMLREAIRRGVEEADDIGFRLGLLAADESDPEDLARFAMLNYEYGQEDESVRLLTTGTALGSTDCEVMLAMILRDRGEYGEARTHAEHAFELGDADSWRLLRDIARMEGDSAGAEAWIRRGIAAADESARISLAGFLVADKRYDEALDAIGPLLVSDDDELRLEALNTELGVRLARGDAESALAVAQRQIGAGDRRGHQWAALLLADDDPAASERHFRYAAAMGSGFAAYRMAGLEERIGNAVEAQTWLLRAEAYDDADAICELAWRSEAAGDDDAALERFRRAADLGSGEALRVLGSRLLDSDPARADELLRQAADFGDELAARMRWLYARQADDPAWTDLLEAAVDVGDTLSLLALAFLIFDDDPAAALDMVAAARESGFPVEELLELAEDDDDRDKIRRMGIDGPPPA